MERLLKLKSDNKGLSLVEMIVSFAILGIVTIALVGMMTTGMRFFRNSTSYIGLQYEYQTVMTQVREYLVDCNAGVVVEGDTLYIVNRVMYDHDNDPMTDDVSGFTTHVFHYEPAPGTAPGTLYYIRKTGVTPVASIDTTAAGDRSVVSARVTDFVPPSGTVSMFGIEPSSATGRATVTTNMRFVSDMREYQASQDIATRNRVVIEVPEVIDTSGATPVTVFSPVPLSSMTYADLCDYLEYLYP